MKELMIAVGCQAKDPAVIGCLQGAFTIGDIRACIINFNRPFESTANFVRTYLKGVDPQAKTSLAYHDFDPSLQWRIVAKNQYITRLLTYDEGRLIHDAPLN